MRLMLALAATWACLPIFAVAAQESTQARASINTADHAVLDNVIVTARRRSENLQTIPAAISAIEGDLLDSSYTVNTQQLSQLVPSLYYNSANPRNATRVFGGLDLTGLPPATAAELARAKLSIFRPQS
jgi:iron complex outermembrane receptor protein